LKFLASDKSGPIFDSDSARQLPEADAQGRIVLFSKTSGLLSLFAKVFGVFVLTVPACFGTIGDASRATMYGYALAICGVGGLLLLILLGIAWFSHVWPRYLVIDAMGLTQGGGLTRSRFMSWQEIWEIRLFLTGQSLGEDGPLIRKTLVSLLGRTKWVLPSYGVAPQVLGACLREYQARACPDAKAEFVDETRWSLQRMDLPS
jgi:hypothetical protein